MTDRRYAPDHVFRDELESFEDAPAWDEPDTVERVAQAFDVPAELLRGSRARVVMVDGDELAEPIEVRSIDVHVRGTDRLADILAQAVEAGRREAARWPGARMAAAGEHMLRGQTVSPWMRSTIGAAVEFDRTLQRTMDQLGATREDLEAQAEQSLRNLYPEVDAAPLGTILCAYCGDRIGQRDRDGAWVDANGLQSCAPRATQHEPETIAGMVVVYDDRVPEGGPWLVAPIVDEVAEARVTLPDGRVVSWSGADDSAWQHVWDGETLPVGCIADRRFNADGTDEYVPCGAPTGEDDDWCPAHKAAIRARAQGDL